MVKTEAIYYTRKRKRKKKYKIKPRFYFFLATFIILISTSIFTVFNNGKLPSLNFGFFTKSNASVTLSNGKTLKSNLKIVDSLSVIDRKIDLQIEEAIDDKVNTFDTPLIIQDPFDRTPLTAMAVFSTSEDTIIRMTVAGDTPADTLTSEFPASKRHRLPILGLYPERKNTITIEKLVDGNVTESKVVYITTESLPSNLQDSVEITSNTGEAVPGLTMISGQSSTTPYAFDSSGVVRWYCKVKTEGHGYFPLADGRFIYMNDDVLTATFKRPYCTHAYDMDFLGRIHNIYLVPNGTHHDVQEKTPGGNIFFISNSLENHVEDLIVEMDRNSGKIVKQLKLGNVIKNIFDTTYDWAHINTVSYNPADGTILISPRNISSGIKIDWLTGKIVWILSDPAVWKGTPYEQFVLKPIGPTQWHYEQHAVYQIKEDIDNDPSTLDLILYDNRSFRVNPTKLNITEGVGRSFVVQYAIDEKNKTVKQLKLFPGTYAFITSNYNLFYDINRLIGFNASISQSGKSWGEVYEYEFSTANLIRSYKTKYTYYRGYRINFGYEAANEPMSQNGNPVKGSLASMKKIKAIPRKPSINIANTANMHILAGMLYIYAPNLTVKNVELVSTKSAYSVELITDPKLNVAATKMKKGYAPSNVIKYYMAVSLENIPKGKYVVNMNYCGVYVGTGATIEIN